MSDFTEGDEINIQPFDKLSRDFEITVQSEARMTNPDGHLPYGVNISTVEAKAYNEETGANVTDELIYGATTVVDNVITASLKWPATSGAGNYKLTFECILDNGQQKEIDFDPVYARDKKRN